MTRNEYIAELNRLAAIHVMGWNEGTRRGYTAVWCDRSPASLRLQWNPCEVPGDMRTVTNRILGWNDIDGVCRWRFDLRYELGHWTAAFYQGDDVPQLSTERWYCFGCRDPECGVAVVKSAIETCGGELPNYVAKGHVDD